MIILPAIDIIDGKPVRLYQGDYGKKEVVASSVLETAKSFEAAGSEYIHLVDLDGAKQGRPCNAHLILETAASVNITVEIGGGIRTMQDAEMYLEGGVSRVILGTAAISDLDFLQAAVTKYGDRIAVGLDCKDGYACASGWLEKSGLYYTSFAKTLEEMGVRTIIFTDISRDGTLNGPNLAMLKELSRAVACNIVASGGIKNISHIRELMEMGLYGAIAGKSIYSKTLDLEEAVRLTKEGI